MADKPQQPEEQVSEQDQSLEAQLDALLRDLESVDPQSVPHDLRKNRGPSAAKSPPPEKPAPTPTQAASTASNMLDQKIDATIESASDKAEQSKTEPTEVKEKAIEPKPAPVVEATKPEDSAKSAKSLNEDELGNQLQALLNDMQVQQAKTDTASTEPETAVAADTTTQPTDTEDSLDAGIESIQQIDAMLAESAEQAISTDDGSGEHIPGTDEILAAQAEAEAAARTEAETKAKPAEPAPVQVQTAPQTPQPVPVIGGATAEDVAKELDEFPQPVPAAPTPVAAKPHPEKPDGAEDRPHEPAVVIVPGVNQDRFAQRLFDICARINRPLNYVSPETRDTIGYVGVLTTFLAFFLMIYGLLF